VLIIIVKIVIIIRKSGWLA